MAIFLTLALTTSLQHRAKGSNTAPQDDRSTNLEIERMLNPSRYIVILGTGKDFPALKRQAQAIARNLGLPFSLRGMIYSPKRGLHVPNDTHDDFRTVRRDDTMTLPSGKESHFISVEESGDYPGLKPGYFIIVGGIGHTPKDAKTKLLRFRPAVPTAYAPKTSVYIGCRS
jgi:hypothetical protein